MEEYMLFIRTEGNPWEKMSPQEMQEHVQKGTAYITDLILKGILKSGQPLAMDGKMISGNSLELLKDGPYNETKEIIAGYLHIVAASLAEAVKIAKANPIFEDGLGAKIEVRPMKVIEGINK